MVSNRKRAELKAADPEAYKAQRRAEYHKAFVKNPTKIRERAWRSSIKRLYDLTVERWEQLFKSQGQVCGLCGQPPIDGERLCVDHNHETGKVRALVHKTPCNIIIGYIEKYGELCRLASSYLDAHK